MSAMQVFRSIRAVTFCFVHLYKYTIYPTQQIPTALFLSPPYPPALPPPPPTSPTTFISALIDALLGEEFVPPLAF